MSVVEDATATYTGGVDSSRSERGGGGDSGTTATPTGRRAIVDGFTPELGTPPRAFT